MSLQKIHLRKLLQIFYAPSNLRTSLLRADIRSEIKREAGEEGGGGDFYGPFWADAKDHTIGVSDLHAQTAIRVKANKGRARLYPELRDGFLTWWNEKRRWHNEPLYPLETPAKARLQIPGMGIVKIENVLGVHSEPGFQRLVYPYFPEKPPLPDEGGRLALWAMQEALPKFDAADMRILDVLRSRTFTIADYPLRGDEQHLFERRYATAFEDWEKLRKHY